MRDPAAPVTPALGVGCTPALAGALIPVLGVVHTQALEEVLIPAPEVVHTLVPGVVHTLALEEAPIPAPEEAHTLALGAVRTPDRVALVTRDQAARTQTHGIGQILTANSAVSRFAGG